MKRENLIFFGTMQCTLRNWHKIFSSFALETDAKKKVLRRIRERGLFPTLFYYNIIQNLFKFCPTFFCIRLSMKPQLGSGQIQWNLASTVVLKINSILPINNKLLYEVNKCFKFSSNDILLFKYTKNGT